MNKNKLPLISILIANSLFIFFHSLILYAEIKLILEIKSGITFCRYIFDIFKICGRSIIV